MKAPAISWMAALAIAAVWAGSASPLSSQETAVPVSAVERLEALKAANALLVERQAKALEKLEDLKQKAEQVRILTKRS